MSGLICPNCKRGLSCIKENRRIEDDYYDVWTCEICPQIIVLYWLGEVKDEN